MQHKVRCTDVGNKPGKLLPTMTGSTKAGWLAFVAPAIAGDKRMSLTQTMIPQRPQSANCSQATRAKAATLEILNISRREAIVAGTHSDYVVAFDGLTCTCRAGLDGLHCSHVLAAIMERARMHGFSHVEFFDCPAAAKAYTVAQLQDGAKAVLQNEHGYIYVTVQPRVTGRLVIDDTRPGRLIVHDQAGSVFGRHTTYLAADDCRRAVLAEVPQ